jgi:hypothetical protein
MPLDTWLATLHPYLTGVDGLQLLSTLVLSWLGARAMCGGDESR